MRVLISSRTLTGQVQIPPTSSPFHASEGYKVPSPLLRSIDNRRLAVEPRFIRGLHVPATQEAAQCCFWYRTWTYIYPVLSLAVQSQVTALALFTTRDLSGPVSAEAYCRSFRLVPLLGDLFLLPDR